MRTEYFIMYMCVFMPQQDIDMRINIRFAVCRVLPLVSTAAPSLHPLHLCVCIRRDAPIYRNAGEFEYLGGVRVCLSIEFIK